MLGNLMPFIAHSIAVKRQAGLHSFEALNIGSGNGYTVLELIATFEHASGIAIARKMALRPDGDLPAFCASANLAAERLGWRSASGAGKTCIDATRWQRTNPNGFAATSRNYDLRKLFKQV